MIAVAPALRRRLTRSPPVGVEFSPSSAPESGLVVRVPLRRREVSAQLLRRAPRTVAGRIALDTPTFLQRPRIHRVESELIEQTGDRRLGPGVVAGDGQRATILCAGWLPVGGECSGVDMVE